MCFEHVRIKMEPVTNAIVYLIAYNINFGALHYFNGIHIVISGYRCSAGIRINFCDATQKNVFLIRNNKKSLLKYFDLDDINIQGDL